MKNELKSSKIEAKTLEKDINKLESELAISERENYRLVRKNKILVENATIGKDVRCLEFLALKNNILLKTSNKTF